jgi:hypothetical protein
VTGVFFLDLKEEQRTNFVVICHAQDRVMRGANIYIVPTPVVERDLKAGTAFYLSFARKNGSRATLTARPA